MFIFIHTFLLYQKIAPLAILICWGYGTMLKHFWPQH